MEPETEVVTPEVTEAPVEQAVPVEAPADEVVAPVEVETEVTIPEEESEEEGTEHRASIAMAQGGSGIISETPARFQ